MNQPSEVHRIDPAAPAGDVAARADESSSAGRRRRATSPARTGKRLLLWGAPPVLGALFVISVVGLTRGGWKKTEQRLDFFRVTPTELRVDILERGTLDSVEKVEIVCEVQSIGGSGYFEDGTSGYSVVGTSGRGTGYGSLTLSADPAFRIPRPSAVALGGAKGTAKGSPASGGSATSTDATASGQQAGQSATGASGGSSASGATGRSTSGRLSRYSGQMGGGGYSFSGSSMGSSGYSGRGRGSSFGGSYMSFMYSGGTQIVFVAPNGSDVKKGDLLVELDSAPLRDRLSTQYVVTERARADQIKANAAYENQKTRNETNLANAELKVELCKLTREQLDAPGRGALQLARQQVDMQIQEALAARQIQETTTDAARQLYALGYESKGSVAKERLKMLSAEQAVAIQLSGRKDVEQYQYTKMALQFDGALATAGRNLIQVKRNNEVLLAQSKARKDAADQVLKKQEQRLKDYLTQLEKCKIHAPRDGIVAYASERGFMSSYNPIYEGALVRERQKILTLPVLDRMQVLTAVHESVRNEIEVDMPATVRVDGIRGRAYQGKVASVAVMPNVGSALDSDTKVYDTVVTIDEKVTQLKPGMTAVVEIHAGRVKNALCAPVQAVVEIDGDHWCYAEAQGGLDRRRVALGRTNEKFVEIRQGVKPGDRLVLNPSSLLAGEKAREKAISPES
jgi:HlyD family secretion protein